MLDRDESLLGPPKRERPEVTAVRQGARLAAGRYCEIALGSLELNCRDVGKRFWRDKREEVSSPLFFGLGSRGYHDDDAS